jgi:16S rRNA (cytidine1402-2'-O)-methyltransferase
MLYIVGTPIGNLEDLTFRALRTLKEADLIACEDTRVTSKLLKRYEIEKPLISYHQHSKVGKIDQIIEKLQKGENIALVTDAGTPGVSDPGNLLVQEAIENGIEVESIPGVSAITTLISISGIDMQKFTFFGFPPHKKGRETFFKKLLSYDHPVMYYESPYRIMKNLNLLREFDDDKKLIVGRELTKMFEEVKRGKIDEVIEYFGQKEKVKGELVVIVH